MENFKEASRLKLRIQTPQGPLSVEQLWDLTPKQLDVVAVVLEQEYKESGKKSFLEKKSEKDKTAKLRFDIVLEILTAKVAEAEAASEAKENKEWNNKIIAMIADKKDKTLAGKSVKELEKMLR